MPRILPRALVLLLATRAAPALAKASGFTEPPQEEASAQALEVLVQAPSAPTGLDSERGELAVDPQEAGGRAAWSLADYVAQSAALTTRSGSAGLGSMPNRLNVAGRGISPRFSSRTQIYLEDMPLALAPYGRPQLTLFGFALGWMDAISVDLGGAASFMGPHSIGGYVRMSLRDFAVGHEERIQVRVQDTGQLSADVLMRMADHRTQWVVGYQTLQGSGYREHSQLQAHSAFVRWRRRIGEHHRLGVLLFGHGEETQIPGGLTPAQFAQDPRASARPLDRFAGARVGGGVFWDAILRPGTTLHTHVAAGLADRKSEISTQVFPTVWASPLRVNPRRFGYLQLHSRLRAQLGTLDAGDQVSSWMELGVVPTLEWAKLKSLDRSPLSDQMLELRAQDDESILATALYGRYVLADSAERWRLEGGLRSSWVRLTRQSQLSSDLGHYRMFALLPSARLWARVHERLSLLASYGQTFSPPQFLQIALAKEQKQLRAERGHSAELGLGSRGPEQRLVARVVGFFKDVRNYSEVSAERFEQPGRLRAFGVETQAQLRWPLRPGLQLHSDLGYTWTHGRIVGGVAEGVLPWVSPHRVRASAGLWLERWGQFFGRLGLRHDSAYRTHYGPASSEDARGTRGQIPAWTTLWASLGLRELELGGGWSASLALGVENILDQLQYTRTPDRNGGRLLLTPRSFRMTLGLRHRKRSR